MKMRAKVICTYQRGNVAEAIASALLPDNLHAPKSIRVATEVNGACVVTLVELDGKIETLLATLDDLLACTSTAESML